MGKIKVGTIKATSPAKDYLGYYPGYQVNTDTSIKDRSGKNNDLKFNTSTSSLTVAEAWNNSNKFSTVYSGAASAVKGVFLDQTVIDQVNFANKEGILILATITVSTPATSTGFIAQGWSTTGGGLRVGITAGNVLKPSFYSSAEQMYFPDSAAITASTPTRLLLYFGGHSSNQVGYFHYLNETSSQGAFSYATFTGSLDKSTMTDPLYLGMYRINSTNWTSLGCQFSSVHILKISNTDNVSTSKLLNIALRYKQSPDSLLVDGDLL